MVVLTVVLINSWHRFQTNAGKCHLLLQQRSSKDPMKCLIASEEKKKQKCHYKCEEHQCMFVPFVVSVDGMLGSEALNTLQYIAQLCGSGREQIITVNHHLTS